MKPTRYYSNKQETKVAKELGMKKQPNSGATAFDKGDLKDDYLLMECKTLTKPQKSHTIQKEWLTKNKEEAFSRGKQIAALTFDFGDGNNHVILEMSDFKEMYEAWKEKYCE
jgi:hypothetical protein